VIQLPRLEGAENAWINGENVFATRLTPELRDEPNFSIICRKNGGRTFTPSKIVAAECGAIAS
jgi:hypothetical protein